MICSSCGKETLGQARFCMHCAAPFARSCASCQAQLPEGARFCPQCAAPVLAAPGTEAPQRDPRAYTPRHLVEKILTSRSAIEGEHKQVTVLFVDVKGSVELAERLGSERWHDTLESFFEILTQGVHRFEGTINQYTGDGIMALFGAPIAHEDHAQRACYTALWLRENLRPYTAAFKEREGVEFAIRMGLSSGEVFVGKVGDDLRMDYTAQGQIVGLAQRMEALAAPGTIFLAETTARQIAPYFELSDRGEFAVKSVRDKVRIFELLGQGAAQSRLDVSRARGFSKFVARSNEMGIFELGLRKARNGEGSVIGIVAEPGVGKSRLCFEFERRCRNEGIMVLNASGQAHAKSIPLLPVMGLLRTGLNLQPSDDAEQARKKIEHRVAQLDRQLLDELPVVFNFLGVADPARPAPPIAGDARMRHVLEFLRRVMVARSQREPAVIIFEDLHWIDLATETFLAALANYVESTRTLLLTTARPEYSAPWTKRAYYSQLALRPLDSAAVDDMLHDWLGDDPSLAGFSARVLAKTGGTPFFVEELIQSLLESGVLEGARSELRLTRAIASIEIPERVASLVASRIDRLPANAKRVLQTAALIGHAIPMDLLERVVDLPRADLPEVVGELVKREFLYEKAFYPDIELAFVHPVTQEVAAGSGPQRRRRQVHAEIATALEELHPNQLDELAGLLAHHWEEAGNPLVAAKWYRRAAHWSGGRHPVSTFEHWSRVRALLDAMPETEETLVLGIEARAKLLLHAGRLRIPAHEYAAAVAEAEAMARRSGNDRALGMVLQHRSWGAALKGASDTEERVREALKLAERAGDADLRVACRCALGAEIMWRGRDPIEQTARLAAEVREITAEDPSIGAEMLGLSPLVFAVWMGAAVAAARSFPEAVRGYEESMKLARSFGDLLMISACAADQVMGWRSIRLVDTANAFRLSALALETSAETGSVLGAIMAYWAMGEAHLLAGSPTHAIQAMTKAAERIEQTGVFAAALPILQASMAEASLMESGTRARTFLESALAGREAGWESPRFDLVAAQVLRETEGAAARDAAETALSNATRLIERAGLYGLSPALHDERAAWADLLRDATARSQHRSAAWEARTRLGIA